MRRARGARAAALLLAAAAAAAQLACANLVLPISFVPVKTEDSTLFPLYANTSLFGVFITGLEFGTPPQSLQLLIDTGSGVTHVAGKGCGSSCGIGLPETRGYDQAGSATARAVPCGDECSCPRCECSTGKGGQPTCTYGLHYADGSSSSGGLVHDRVSLSGEPLDMVFGVQERQTGVLQSMGIDGLLGLDRTSTSFVSQLRAYHDNQTAAGRAAKPVAFGICWEFEYNGREQGYPGRNASSFLMLGLPDAILDALDPTFTPLQPGPPAEWAVGIEAVEVLGGGGGNITEELYPPPFSLPPLVQLPPGVNASVLEALRAEQEAKRAAQEGAEPHGEAILDSGATYTHLPRAAWRRFVDLVSAAAEARGKVKRVVAREGVVCWDGLGEDAITSDAAKLAEAFPSLELRFAGGASFVASPEGYLVQPDTGGAHLACLSIFPWDQPLTLLGARIRRRVLTIHDDTGERVGFARVEDCEELADAWKEAE